MAPSASANPPLLQSSLRSNASFTSDVRKPFLQLFFIPFIPASVSKRSLQQKAVVDHIMCFFAYLLASLEPKRVCCTCS